MAERIQDLVNQTGREPALLELVYADFLGPHDMGERSLAGTITNVSPGILNAEFLMPTFELAMKRLASPGYMIDSFTIKRDEDGKTVRLSGHAAQHFAAISTGSIMHNKGG